MTTSFTRTRTQIANMVLGKLGIIEAGGTARTADADVVYEAIDLRLKEMHRLGIFWRKVSTVPLSFTLTAGVNSASATADILFPIALHITDSSQDEQIEIIGIREYAAIPDKTDSGVPTVALWKGGAEFVFHPVPLSTTTAKLTYEKIADDTSADAAVDVDVAMIRWLGDIIKYDLGDYYGKDGQTMARFKAECDIAERNIRKLAVQNVDYSTVRVDDYDTPQDKSDWNTG